MKLFLLDTHILLWWLCNSSRLHPKIRKLIANPDNEIYISPASVWEASIKRELGRLEFDDEELLTAIESGGFLEVAVTIRHGLIAGSLPRHHEDPFDRMLIAQAQVENFSIITHDAKFKYYEVPIIWA
ncbi:type II toxin-antitoxin system VapC family toxin [Candidatus Parabeggiatoa sp. HSG14]|uniref:type II toxin-antitoxin system VapC family toxin n=1 Tax=Candidatus Parabeggiatoa sp. HSG14 TaxID=3055593 RepID=UPI0025A92EF9|nr:type II toxin-antitoxin system VapC family toxin [Thiotrichales bacterium HSG14]